MEILNKEEDKLIAAKKKAINDIIKKVNIEMSKTYKTDKPFIVNLGEHPEYFKNEFVPIGIDAVDILLGGGLPKKCILTIHGKQFSGKTCLAWTAMAKYTKMRKYVLYINTEVQGGVISEAAKKTFDIDEDYIVYVEPWGAAENFINTIERFLLNEDTKQPNDLIDLVVIDSINNLITNTELKKLEKEGAEGMSMAARAKMITEFLQRVDGLNYLRNGASMILIAQDRALLNGMGMGPTTTMSGGHSLRYASKIILKLAPKPNLKKTGHKVIVTCEKNKIIGSLGACEYDVIYGEGIDDVQTTLDKALEWGYIVKESRSNHKIILPDGDRIVTGASAGLKSYIEDHVNVKLAIRAELEKGKPKTAPISTGVEVVETNPLESLLGTEEELENAQDE
jgi:recombination protein RecA